MAGASATLADAKVSASFGNVSGNFSTLRGDSTATHVFFVGVDGASACAMSMLLLLECSGFLWIHIAFYIDVLISCFEALFVASWHWFTKSASPDWVQSWSNSSMMDQSSEAPQLPCDIQNPPVIPGDYVFGTPKSAFPGDIWDLITCS